MYIKFWLIISREKNTTEALEVRSTQGILKMVDKIFRLIKNVTFDRIKIGIPQNKHNT